MASGTEVYNADKPPVTARGISYTDEEFEASLNGSVSDILNDTSGKSDIETMLATVTTTEFAQENLKEALETTPTLQSWRVGEALAEAYLTEHRDCTFPWPTSRNSRNPEASPAGADLVGFQEIEDTNNRHRFAFGEVKTSEEEQYPPNTMYGRHGMVKQLENLRDSKKAKDALFLYLGYHATNADWNSLYLSAACRYLDNPDDVSLFGVLARDVEPRSEDLDSCAKAIAVGCPAETSVDLRALYFPKGSINNLSERALEAMEGNNADN